MRWGGHMECVGEKTNAYRVWCGNMKKKKKGCSKDSGVDKKPILTGTFTILLFP
jgi:hypothetical protein